MAHPASRQEKLTCKEVHLNLFPFTVTVVDNAIDADRRRFDGSHGIGIGRRCELVLATELNMSDFVRNEKCVGEVIANVFMQNEQRLRIVDCPATVEANVSLEVPSRLLDFASPLRHVLRHIVPTGCRRGRRRSYEVVQRSAG